LNEGSYKFFFELDRVSCEQLDQERIIKKYPGKRELLSKNRIFFCIIHHLAARVGEKVGSRISSTIVEIILTTPP
jgi:hypothetical protein